MARRKTRICLDGQIGRQLEDLLEYVPLCRLFADGSGDVTHTQRVNIDNMLSNPDVVCAGILCMEESWPTWEKVGKWPDDPKLNRRMVEAAQEYFE